MERKDYRPQPLLRQAIPKANGKLRYLAIPTVRDRVLHTAIARAITPELEAAFEHASFAYRAGRSVQMAVARVAHYRDQGYRWVVDADIQSFFDEVDHTLLEAKLRRTLSDDSLLPLIGLLLAATIAPEDGQPFLLDKGIPQGSPLSPALANLYLDDFDEAILAQDMRLVRFADDFLILCKDADDARSALAMTESVIQGLSLRLNADKTRIVHFDEGFRFLGVDFVRNLMEAADADAERWLVPTAAQRAALKLPDPDAPSSPPEPHTAQAPTLLPPAPAERDALPEADEPAEGAPEAAWALERHPALSPLIRTLYVSEQGVALRKENERVLVTRKKTVLLSWPLGKLDEIVVLGNAMASTALLRHCATAGIAVHFSNAGGNMQASLQGVRAGENLPLLEAQLRLSRHPDLPLALARSIVEGKIHNQRIILKRYNRRRRLPALDDADTQLAAMLRRLADAETLNTARGCEGQAAHAYFRAIAQLIPAEWGFTKRVKRPPGDPVNALLSLGYGMLHKTLHGVLVRQALHPQLGVLHAEKPGHAALASDLMEEFRAPVVDTTVLQAVLELHVRPGDFTWHDDETAGCQLTKPARKRVLEMFAKKFAAQLIHPQAGIRMDYHRAMLYQANLYRRVVLREVKLYTAFKLR